MFTKAIMITAVFSVVILTGLGCIPKPNSNPTLSKPEPTTVAIEQPTKGSALDTKSRQLPATIEQPTDTTNPPQFSGAILAGQKSLLLDYNQTDYAAALKSNKLITLYFYANWCPLCKTEFPEMQDAFNQLSTDQVIGFRVNFNDNETDETERELAREFGVAYQHTKVFVRNGQRLLKAPDSWDQQRYLSEIFSILK